MIIRYFTRNVYGVSRIYIADQTTKQIIAKLTNSTTITDLQIQGLKELGCTFEEVKDPKSAQPS